MVAGMRNGVSGGNVWDIRVCCFVCVLPKERLSACVCLGDAECGKLNLLCCRIWMSSVTTERVCIFVLFYAESTFVCVCGTCQQYTAVTSSEYEVNIEMDFYVIRTLLFLTPHILINKMHCLQYNKTDHKTHFKLGANSCVFQPQVPSSESLLKTCTLGASCPHFHCKN